MQVTILRVPRSIMKPMAFSSMAADLYFWRSAIDRIMTYYSCMYVTNVWSQEWPNC